MTETLWAVIIGGAIASVTGFLTTWIATRTETQKWVREKKLENLQRKRNELNLLFEKLVAILQNFDDAIKAGEKPYIPKFSDVYILNLRFLELNNLFVDALQARANEKSEGDERLATWGAKMNTEMVKIDSEIEKLLK